MSSSKAGRKAGSERRTWRGMPPVQIYRYLGKQGVSAADAMKVVSRVGMKPNRNTASSQVGAGSTGRLKAPTVDAGTAAALRSHLKAVTGPA